jgi:REP element-mobilizing transposase RayT
MKSPDATMRAGTPALLLDEGSQALPLKKETLEEGTQALPVENGTQAPSLEKGWHSRGYVPHFDVSGLYQAITYRLGDSLPKERSRSAGVPPALSPTSPALPPSERRQQVEEELNKGYGSCILRDQEIAQIVVDAWKHFDGHRYELVAYVVMPNHVHVLIKTYEGFPLSQVVHSWKSFTAHAIARYLKRCGRDARALEHSISVTGARTPPHLIDGRDARAPTPTKVWQNDYFDRFIRDERHFAQAIAYIHENPVKAGLCGQPNEWPWSSIHEERHV